MSRIGKKPIIVPEGTKLELREGVVYVAGPKGALERGLLEGLELAVDGNVVTVKRGNDDKKSRSYHGLMRTLIANMVQGVHEGFEKKLEIIGIGYRAELQGTNVVFYLGYSHPIVFPLPEGISANIEKQTLLTVRGVNKELLGEVAAKMRSLRKPDVYKNKGVKYATETLRKKAGKSGK
jgi:large subunit ribosomal protein L6